MLRLCKNTEYRLCTYTSHLALVNVGKHTRYLTLIKLLIFIIRTEGSTTLASVESSGGPGSAAVLLQAGH